MHFQFYSHTNIDMDRWDHAIRNCENENPYAYSAWLNLVCPGWGAYINKNYSILIPIPLKSKFGIKYVSQPLFTQQLGVFHSTEFLQNEYAELMSDLKQRFKKIHYQFNITTPLLQGLKTKSTYVLPLNKSYEEIYNGFSSHHKRNISKALKLSVELDILIETSDDVDLFIKHFKYTSGSKDTSLKEADYVLLEKIMRTQNGKMYLCKANNGSVLAGLYSLESKTKLVNLFNFVTDEGKKNRAMFGILNEWIKYNSGSHKVIDFEGSEIESIAEFYAGFGANRMNYQIFTKKGFWQM